MLLRGLVLSASFVLLTSCTHSRTNSQDITSIPSDYCEHDKFTFRCVKFIKNYDADTVTVDIPNIHPLLGEKIPVRVNGIDSPEVKGKSSCEKEAAKEAQQLVEALLKKASRIDLNNVRRDKYFRIGADITADGQSIKELLLKHKLAYEYEGKAKPLVDWCQFTKQ